ncbi:MAG: fimbrillin family protein [Clostridia bacterium]|nr:fimbrillin family protein [Clostridia bacterium]
MEIVVSFDAGDYEWKTGDELYFCRVSRDNQWEEYCFTATVAEDGTVTWTSDKTLYWDGTGEHRLFVSYPCTAVGWDDFMIPTDQSDVDKLKEADCMNARWIGTPTTNVIEFELKHRMAKITVNYVIASQFDLDAPIIAEIYSNSMYCFFSDADGLPIITSVGQYDAWITPYHNANQFTVYVAPGEYNTDGLFKFYVGDAEVQIEITTPGAVTLEEGGEYTFDVKVGQDVFRIAEVSMGDIDSPFGDGWHNEIDLKAIGTQDIGKTAWEIGDQIIVTFTSPRFGTQYGTLTYDGTVWSTDVSFSYLEGEIPTVSAIYAPCYEVVDGNMQLKDGMQLGMTEYISAACSITDETLNISFKGATRNYSRLRISALPGQTLTVNTTDFTPAGATDAATDAYTLTADENGNTYLYGTFAEGATVSVKQGEVTLADYTFTAEKHPEGTKSGINYALDARPIIDGTLGGKTEATEEDINALVDQLKAYVDNGITTIIVTGSVPAMYNLLGSDLPAVSAAIFFLGSSGSTTNGDPDSPYCGTIDLIMPDATSLAYMEFCSTYALNSVTLPKVTKLADRAFYDTPYLRTITFGSVLTEINETGGVMFALVGEEVGGCDLILNCGQMNETNVPTPDLTTNTWKFKFENEFKSITLTHTGECDECTVTE